METTKAPTYRPVRVLGADGRGTLTIHPRHVGAPSDGWTFIGVGHRTIGHTASVGVDRDGLRLLDAWLRDPALETGAAHWSPEPDALYYRGIRATPQLVPGGRRTLMIRDLQTTGVLSLDDCTGMLVVHIQWNGSGSGRSVVLSESTTLAWAELVHHLNETDLAAWGYRA